MDFLRDVDISTLVFSLLALAAGLRLITRFGISIRGLIGLGLFIGGLIFGFKSFGMVEASIPVWVALVIGVLALATTFRFLFKKPTYAIVSFIVALVTLYFFVNHSTIPAFEAVLQKDNPGATTVATVWTWIDYLVNG
jgi:hypothetical protein